MPLTTALITLAAALLSESLSEPAPPKVSVTQEAVIRHIRDTDETGDAGFVADLVAAVLEHDDWVLVSIDPRDFQFNLHPLGEVEDYRDVAAPVVVKDGFIIDGSHRASAALHDGRRVMAYISKSQVSGQGALQGPVLGRSAPPAVTGPELGAPCVGAEEGCSGGASSKAWVLGDVNKSREIFEFMDTSTHSIEDHVEWVHPGDLHADDLDQPRTPEGVALYRQRLQEGAPIHPIIAYDDGLIWDGHHRHEAALAEGVDEIPVLFVTYTG